MKFWPPPLSPRVLLSFHISAAKVLNSLIISSQIPPFTTLIPFKIPLIKKKILFIYFSQLISCLRKLFKSLQFTHHHFSPMFVQKKKNQNKEAPKFYKRKERFLFQTIKWKLEIIKTSFVGSYLNSPFKVTAIRSCLDTESNYFI